MRKPSNQWEAICASVTGSDEDQPVFAKMVSDNTMNIAYCNYSGVNIVTITAIDCVPELSNEATFNNCDAAATAEEDGAEIMFVANGGKTLIAVDYADNVLIYGEQLEEPLDASSEQIEDYSMVDSELIKQWNIM